MAKTDANTETRGLKAETLSAVEENVRTEKVLLLEDHEAFATVVKDFLGSHGMEVDRGINGVEGVGYLMASDYDFIVCDMVMPEFPGDMFYRAVQQVKPHLCERFIFVTGHQGDEKVHEFIRKVKGLVLWKPFSLERLLEAMKIIRSFRSNAREPRSFETVVWRRTIVDPLNN